MTCAIAAAIINLTLTKKKPYGFSLSPAAFTAIGCQIAHLKRQLGLAQKSLSTIIGELSLLKYFSVAAVAKSEKFLKLNTASLLRHPSSTVQALLPDTHWSVQPAPGLQRFCKAAQPMHSSTQSTSEVATTDNASSNIMMSATDDVSCCTMPSTTGNASPSSKA